MSGVDAEKLLALIVELEEAAMNVGIMDSRGGDEKCDADLKESRNAVTNFIIRLLK
jgi:hypothetical protein